MNPIFHLIAGAPDPVAPFSHAVEADGWVFITGQMPFAGQVGVHLLHFDEDAAAMNTVYASYFLPGKRPARTCVGVSGLAKGARIEIDMVARR